MWLYGPCSEGPDAYSAVPAGREMPPAKAVQIGLVVGLENALKG